MIKNDIDFIDVLHKAVSDFSSQFDRWNFDERDDADSLQYFIEKRLGRKMNSTELKDKEYTQLKKRADKLADAAAAVAYKGRTGPAVDLKKAEYEYEKVKNALFESRARKIKEAGRIKECGTEDDLIKKIKEMIQQELEEISTTADAPGYMTPHAFAKTPKTRMPGGWTKAAKGGKNLTNLNKSKRDDEADPLYEISYPEYKSDPSASPKQKVNRAIHEINSKLFRIERVIDQNLRLKSETKLSHSDYWKSTGAKFVKISERMVRVSKKIRELGG